MAVTFFSEDWCKEALVAEHAATDEIRRLLADPAGFTHVLALEVSDRPGAVAHFTYSEGRCVVCTPDFFSEEQVWARFTTSLDLWRQLAGGTATVSGFLLEGTLKLRKGDLPEVLADAPSFDRLVECFGTIDTDWKI